MYVSIGKHRLCEAVVHRLNNYTNLDKLITLTMLLQEFINSKNREEVNF